jgi:hypothetical protein
LSFFELTPGAIVTGAPALLFDIVATLGHTGIPERTPILGYFGISRAKETTR